jgi:chlorobactene glucosyltransferase
VLNFVVFSIFPAPFSLLFHWPSLAIAHGACLAFSRRSYFEIGGHAAVRDQIFEDVRLAQLWRAKKARGLCLDGQEVVRVRMYASFAEIWRGFQKNFFPAFRYEINFWLFLLFHFTVFFGPVLLVVLAPTTWAWIALGCVILLRLLLAQYFGHPLWSALVHPVSEPILLLLGLSSWWRCKSGRGVTWKGREYHKTA